MSVGTLMSNMTLVLSLEIKVRGKIFETKMKLL